MDTNSLDSNSTKVLATKYTFVYTTRVSQQAHEIKTKIRFSVPTKLRLKGVQLRTKTKYFHDEEATRSGKTVSYLWLIWNIVSCATYINVQLANRRSNIEEPIIEILWKKMDAVKFVLFISESLFSFRKWFKVATFFFTLHEIFIKTTTEKMYLKWFWCLAHIFYWEKKLIL